jgi:hypothetical protein
LAVQPTHPPVRWIPGAVSLELKQLYCFNPSETDNRNEHSLIKTQREVFLAKIVAEKPENIRPLREDLGLNSRNIIKVESIML